MDRLEFTMSAECIALPFELPTLSSNRQPKQSTEEKITKLNLVEKVKDIDLKPVTVDGRLTVSF